MLKRLTALALLVTLLLGAAPVTAAVVGPGDRGSQVAAIQQRLKNLSYFSGEVDGVYGDDTYAAVWWFQKDSGLKVDAIVGNATMAKLFPPTAVDLGTLPKGDIPRMSEGSRSTWVRYLQQRLKVLGYYTGGVDGVFGPRTRDAVIELQDNNAIAKDGVVGSRTGKLVFSEHVIGKSARDSFSGKSKLRIKYGDRGEYVIKLQQRLKELGYFDGRVDGHFGYYTFIRVRWFQKAHNLTIDGVVGPGTWSALFP